MNAHLLLLLLVVLNDCCAWMTNYSVGLWCFEANRTCAMLPRTTRENNNCNGTALLNLSTRFFEIFWYTVTLLHLAIFGCARDKITRSAIYTNTDMYANAIGAQANKHESNYDIQLIYFLHCICEHLPRKYRKFPLSMILANINAETVLWQRLLLLLSHRTADPHWRCAWQPTSAFAYNIPSAGRTEWYHCFYLVYEHSNAHTAHTRGV